jgi:hypothetical protein
VWELGEKKLPGVPHRNRVTILAGEPGDRMSFELLIKMKRRIVADVLISPVIILI